MVVKGSDHVGLEVCKDLNTRGTKAEGRNTRGWCP